MSDTRMRKEFLKNFRVIRKPIADVVKIPELFRTKIS